MKHIKKVIFLPYNKTCEFAGRPSILEVALANEIPLNHSCGGMGSCTTCRVFIKSNVDKLSPPESVELEQIKMRGWQPHERLGCQCEAIDGLTIEIPTQPESDSNKSK